MDGEMNKVVGRYSKRASVVLLALIFMAAATVSSAIANELQPEVEGSEAAAKTTPSNGAELTAPARSLRVWLDHTPVVEKSSLSLEGPNGSLEVQGLHTMGADDLMARVVGPMPNGEYTAKWTSEDADGKTSTGTWTFTIQRAK